MKDKNKIYFYIAIFLLLSLFYFNFSTFKEGAASISSGQVRNPQNALAKAVRSLQKAVVPAAAPPAAARGAAPPPAAPPPAAPLPPVPPLINWDPYELNTDYTGNDILGGRLFNSTPTACLTNCDTDPLCKGFVYDSRNNDCWKKSALNLTDKKIGLSGLYAYKKTVSGTGSGTGSGSGSDSSCSALIADTLKYEKESLDAKSQAMAVEEDYIYNQARILSAPSISQLNVGTGIINELTQETDGLKKQITDERDAANNAEILQLRIDASNNDATNATTKAILEQTISELQTSINTNTSQLEQHDRDAKIREAVERTEKDWNAKYTSLNDGINTQISQKIGGYTPQHTLQQTMRDICDNVISSIGDTTKVLTDKMGNFVGPDGLLSKFNGFTNDNTLYSSIDKIDTNVTEQDIILKNILNTLKYYTENKNNVDDSGNVIKPIPYEADSLIHIDTRHYCTSDYDDKLGAPLCCGLTGVLKKEYLGDQCGPYAKYCVQEPRKSHGFCSSNKPTIT